MPFDFTLCGFIFPVQSTSIGLLIELDNSSISKLSNSLWPVIIKTALEPDIASEIEF